MKTIEDFLCRNARLYADRPAIVTPRDTITYAELWQRVSAKARAIAALRGRAVVFRGSQTADFLIHYFAIHLAGAVAVPLEHDVPDSRLTELEAELSHCVLPADVADVLYTTGTTGRSKGVMVSHRAILANSDNLVKALNFSHDLVFVICGPMNHIGCLSKVYPVVQCGATLYLLEGMKDLNAFYQALDYPCAKAATFLVPASIRMLLTFSADRLQTYAAKLDFIETGAAPIAQTDMRQLCRLLPHSRLYNTYASTETGIIATYNFNDGHCFEGCVGTAMPHARFTVDSDRRIRCQGDTLMSGYAGNEALTASVLTGGELLTADLGRVDAEGRLHLMGRSDDIINTGGLKVAPEEVEKAALAMGNIAECLCVAANHPVVGTVLRLLVVMRPGHELKARELARHLRERLEAYKVPMLYEQVETIRKTFNGKPDRKSYR